MVPPSLDQPAQRSFSGDRHPREDRNTTALRRGSLLPEPSRRECLRIPRDGSHGICGRSFPYHVRFVPGCQGSLLLLRTVVALDRGPVVDPLVLREIREELALPAVGAHVLVPGMIP